MTRVNSFRTNTTSSLKRPKGRDPNTWWWNRPLSEAKTAARTNTRQQMSQALQSNANWLEGEVRRELNGGRLQMRHSTGPEPGESLSLDEWLALGRAAGRGLKLDVKEPQAIDQAVRQVKAAGVPSERLMWSVGDAAMSTWGAKLRQQFPRAILAIYPSGEKRLNSADVARLISLAKRGAGGPIAFVIHADRLTDESIEALKAFGKVCVWSQAGRFPKEDLLEVADEFRDRGVDGSIELQRNAPLVVSGVRDAYTSGGALRR